MRWRSSYTETRGEAVTLAKHLACQRYIYKIHSSRLRRERWKLSLPLDEARNNDEVVALADSQVLRWIDEINGVEDMDLRAFEVRSEIRRIKREPNSLKNKKKIKELYSKLDEIQYKPDYLCLIIDKEKDYRRACQGFEINGVRYVRLLGTNGGIKNSTIVFVSARVADELRRRIENGRDPDKPLVTAKLEAYKALACSASIPVSLPNGILVVKDCMTKFKSDIVYLTDENVGYPTMELRRDEEIELDASDGFGLMLPKLAKRWSQELGLDYVMSGCNTRFSFEKGMAFTFDFIDFADKIAGRYIVKDVWGNEVDIRDVELILTESMVKLWDSYKSCEDYLRNSLENKYSFSVTKVAPEELESERALNYQFIQSYRLTDKDIDDLIRPTADRIRDTLGMDWVKSVLFMSGSYLNERNVDHTENVMMRAVMADPRVIEDPHVQNSIFRAIKRRVDDAKIGVVDVHGNYSVISGDPYALCQSIFGMKVTGLLKAGEIYSKYWNDHGVDDVACFRAPMTCHNNIRLAKLAKDINVKYWLRHMKTCTVLNAWDTMMSALNGADFDGDNLFVTDNSVLVNKLIPSPALMCAQRKASKIVPTEKDFIQSNIESFGNDIGRTTNWVTSMFEVQSHYPEGSEEYNELSYRIRCGQLYQQNAIDKAKGILCKPMPREWHDWHAANNLETNSEMFKRIVADKKPYFMRYIYPQLMREYKKYVKSAEKNAMREFDMSIAEIEELPECERTDRQREFLRHYYRKMPVGTGDCVMNIICRKFEAMFDGGAWRKSDSKFDYTLMKSGADYSSSLYYSLQKLYNEYNANLQRYVVHASYEKTDNDEFTSELFTLRRRFIEDCDKICPNSATLCDILLDICYRKDSTKKFVWDICGEQIVQNLLNKNDRIMTFPTLDAKGDIEYGGQRFKLSQKRSEVEE